jgi:hypothetical protein
MSASSFHESQRVSLRRQRIALAIPPIAMLALILWQVVLHHPWGKQPMSNGSLIGWTVFLWLVYFRLITVRLVTDVRDSELLVAMRGLWRKRRIPLSEIQSVEEIGFNPERDFGGYGIRTTRTETAYVASGTRGVRLRLSSGVNVVVGSAKPDQLAGVLKGRPTEKR